MYRPRCPPLELLRSAHLGTLPDGPLAEVTAHLAQCADCEEVIQRLEAMPDPLLSALRRQGPLPDETVTGSGVPVASTGLPEVPGYDVLEVLGEGGMGVVYRARQRRLRRHVALKRLRTARTAERERFQAEALAVARLQHHNVVSLYEVFDHDGQQYLALELVNGGSLDQLTGQPMAPPRAAALVLVLARAVQHAHECGVVHRDLKPSNILLQEVNSSQQTVDSRLQSPTRAEATSTDHRLLTADYSAPATDFIPKITDFGIARHPAAGPRQTLDGDVIGTPAYMAPEQAAGRTSEAGPPADIYSLGVILYELLTGRPPLLGATSGETLQLVLTREPVLPRTLQPQVPRDLETITLKCLGKEPVQRYPSALALAEDLQRFLDDRPILARPAGVAERAWKWSRRRPLVAGLLVAVATVTILGSVGVTGALLYALAGWQRASVQEHKAVLAIEETRGLRDASRQLSARLTLEKGIALAEQGDVARGLQYMRESLVLDPAEIGESGRLARINLGSWGSQLHGLRLVLEHPEEVKAVAFSPDGRTMVTGTSASLAQRWEVATGRPIGPPLRTAAWVWAVAFSPDGKTIATAGGTPAGGRRDQDCSVQFWDAGSGTTVGQPLVHDRRVWCVAYHPGGKTIATGSDEQVRVWDVATRRLVLNLKGHTSDVRSLAYSTNGHLLASASSDGTIRIWETDTGKPRKMITSQTGEFRAVAFHPDGRLLASAGFDGTARLWNVDTGQAVGEPMRHPDVIETLAFTPDGMALVTGCYDGNARLWDLGTGRTWGSPLGHRLRVTSVAVTGDGRAILTGSLDRTARVWKMGRSLSPPAGLMRSGQASARPVAPTLQFTAANYSPDRTTVVTTGNQGFAELWEVATGRPIGEPMQHPAPDVRTAIFSPDGKLVATTCLTQGVAAGTVRLWDAATGRPRSAWMSHPAEVVALAFSPDSQTLATGDFNYDVRLWDTVTGKIRGPAWRQRDIVLSLAFSPDGRTLAAGTANSWHRDPQARLWDVTTGQPRGEPMRHQHWVHFLSFTPDGRALLTGSRDGTARLWDAVTGQPLGPPMRHQFEWTCAAFSPDGRTLLTGGQDGVARLWYTSDGQPAGPPLAHPAAVQSVAFSPDGRTLLVGCKDSGARLWDAGTSIPLGPALAQGYPLLSVAFAADGLSLITTAEDGTTRCWPLPHVLEGDVESLALWLQVRTGLAMDAGGQAPAPLDPATWEERRRDLAAIGGDAGANLGPSVDDLAWHEVRAREAEQRWALYSAQWHLDHLAALHPRDWLVFARRGRVRVAEARLKEAAAEYRCAEKLGPPAALQAWYSHEETHWRLRKRDDIVRWYAEWIRSRREAQGESGGQ